MLLGPVSLDRGGVRGLWRRLTPAQKISLAGVAGLMVIVLGIFANAARGPEYVAAFSGLKDEEAAAVVAKLKDSKVPYELGERGTIKVPPGQVQEVRLLMAGTGVLGKGGANSVGYEMFNQPHIGMTEFAEKINYQRALEGELSRTIDRLDAVDSSRVHIVIPQPSLFSANQKDTTASVVIQLKPGRRLDSGQIQGITQLVASSVEGLKQQNVTVMDSSGNLLSEGKEGPENGRLTGNRRDVQRALESRVEEDVRTMLGRVVGADKVIVRANADLDWDQYEATNETYSPDQKAPQIRSQRQVSEVQSQGAGANGVGGVPGTNSNVPTYQARAGNGQSQTERQETQTNYELSKTVEKMVRAPGGIRRMSVAVALDSEALADPAQADAISKLVATAAGINQQRGDVVTLTTLPFNVSSDRKAAEAAEAARQREFVLTIARLLAMVLGPLLVVAFVWFTLRRGRKQVERPKISVVKDAPGALTAEPVARLQPAPEEVEHARLQQELTELAKNEPTVVAQLVRAWLVEDKKPA